MEEIFITIFRGMQENIGAIYGGRDCHRSQIKMNSPAHFIGGGCHRLTDEDKEKNLYHI